jgi:hypothetical protein
LVGAVAATLLVGVGQAAAATTVRVSVSSSGAQGNSGSRAVAISAGGRFVLFDSDASNLVRGDRNGRCDVFLRDLRSGRTVRVSVGRGGREANGVSWGAAVSPDGRFVVFMSEATNLTSTPDRNGSWDIFLRDRARGTTSRISVPPGGGQFGPVNRFGLGVAGLSDNGRYVAFSFWTPDQQPIYLRDRLHQTTHIVGGTRGWWFDPYGLSANGQWLVYGGEYSGGGSAVSDVYIRNLWTHHTTRIPSGWGPTNIVISRDAHYVAFNFLNEQADGMNTARWNRVTGRVVPVRDDADPSGISTDGRYVAVFAGHSPSVSGPTHMLRIDLATHTITRIDTTTSGAPAPKGVGKHGEVLLSADGRFGLFTSSDSSIVPNDTNHAADVFLRGPLN